MSKKTITVQVKHRTAPRTKHTGILSDEASACYDDELYVTRSTGECFYLRGVMLHARGGCMGLKPAEALSLLSWLQQERGVLEQMVREQAQ